MTQKTNARVAGSALLLYIVTGIGNMFLSSKIGGVGTGGRLAALASHPTLFGLEILHTLIEVACAITLGITMYALTRDVDNELAIAAMVSRIIEGTIGIVAVAQTLALMWLATEGANTADTTAIASLLFKSGSWTFLLAGFCFAVGSLIFSILFVRGRSIPVALGWIGVVASALLVIVLPLEMTRFVKAGILVWIPMIFFEVPLAFWLILKGTHPAKAIA